MPHQCIECSRTFADGSKQMLAGCPDCGGNKFQFRPKGSVSVDESSSAPEPSKPATPQQSTNAASRGKTRTTTLKEWAKQKVTPGSSTAEAPSASATATSTNPKTSTSTTTSTPQSRGESTDTVANRSTATDLDSFGGESAELAHPDERAGKQPAERLDDAETLDDSDREDSAQADARGGFVGEDELPDPPTAREEPQQPEESEPRPNLAQLREELNDQFESIKVVEPGQYELNLMELYDRDEYIIALQENGRYVIEVPDAWDATE